MKNWKLALGFAIAGVFAQGCAGATRGDGDSETHWVACKTDDECPGSMTCVANYCKNTPASGGATQQGTGGSGAVASAGSGGSGAGTSGDPAWSCLGTGVPAVTEETEITLQVRPLLVGTALEQVKIDLCRRVDVECVEPIGPTRTADADGRVTMTIPAGFNGYVWVTSSGNVPTLYFINPRTLHLATNGVETIVQVASQSILDALNGSAQVPSGNGNGTVLVRTFDCTGKLASGVALEAEPVSENARIFYATGSLPNVNAVETDAAGYGGLLNAEPGAVNVRATRASTSQYVGTLALLVRPNSLSVGTIAPDDS